jgi:hypothetical protein
MRRLDDLDARAPMNRVRRSRLRGSQKKSKVSGTGRGTNWIRSKIRAFMPVIVSE